MATFDEDKIREAFDKAQKDYLKSKMRELQESGKSFFNGPYRARTPIDPSPKYSPNPETRKNRQLYVKRHTA